MLYSNDFLEQLFLQPNREIYGKAIALDIDELQQQVIEGLIINGSINVDGKSSVRRTCQLSILIENTNIFNYDWTLNTKFSLSVGIKNNINSYYPEIIWFPQGVYILTSFSSSVNGSNVSVNISGKDKMCLLNGEIGGHLPFEVDFGQWEEKNADGSITLHKYPLKDIIREAVHAYGGEPFHNIIINDLDDRGMELQEYKFDIPLYLIRKSNEPKNYIQTTLNSSQRIYVVTERDSGEIELTPSTLGNLQESEFDLLIDDLSVSTKSPTLFQFASNNNPQTQKYCAAKVVYGQTVGYTITDMFYTGDLIAKSGETITSVLDKIKNMLGNFEYFYDIDGKFIFQEQKNYLYTSWSPAEKTADGIAYADPTSNKIQFIFNDNLLITSLNNTPNLLNLKNDYSVWGTRTSQNGGKIPIHMRYAIDNKPIIYNTIEVSDEEAKALDPKLSGQESKTYISELTYNTVYEEYVNRGLLSLDFNIQIVNTIQHLANLNAEKVYNTTALETNLIDLVQKDDIDYVKIQVHCDWRELIYQMALDYRKYGHLDNFELKVAQANPHYPSGKTGYEQYYIDLEGFWRQLYNYEEQSDDFYPAYDQERKYWNKSVYEAPEKLNFWFDFLDSEGELFNYSVKKIGLRSKVVNDKDVSAIYYKQTPEIIFSQPNDDISTTDYTAQNKINIPKLYGGMLKPSAQGKSAKSSIDNLLYNHSYCAESISLSSLPVYNLEPNKRIYIKDEETGIDGEYLVTQFNIPLQHNGIMNIKATKAIDRII